MRIGLWKETGRKVLKGKGFLQSYMELFVVYELGALCAVEFHSRSTGTGTVQMPSVEMLAGDGEAEYPLAPPPQVNLARSTSPSNQHDLHMRSVLGFLILRPPHPHADPPC